MMKVKVIRRYKDLELKAIQEVNTIIDVDDKRAEVLLGKGFVEKVEAVKTEDKKIKTQ